MKNICFEKRFLSDLKSLSTLVAASSHLFVNVGGGPLCLLVDLHLEHLVLHRKFGPQRNIVVVCVIDHLGSFGLHIIILNCIQSSSSHFILKNVRI